MHTTKKYRHWCRLGLWLALYAGFLSPATATEDFKQWAAQQRAAFQAFRDARDREFAEYLYKEWTELQGFKAQVRDPAPKPRIMPRVSSPQRREAAAKLSRIAATPPRPATSPVESAPVSGNTLAFYGYRLALPAWPGTVVQVSPDKAGIRAFWNQTAQQDYPPLLAALQAHKARLELDDWSYYLLLRTYVAQAVPAAADRSAYLWFLLLKSGYAARLGYTQQRLLLLLPVRQQVYAQPYYVLDGRNYYWFDGKKSPAIQTYRGEHPSATRSLSITFQRLPNMAGEQRTRPIRFRHGKREFTLTLPYDAQRVALLATYPQLDLNLYFAARHTHPSARQLIKQLRPLVDDRKTLLDKLNLLLHFVQNGFPYATDDEQFGYENYLLLEELAYYTANDCEDRSFLLAWLVQELLGLEVRGITWPGHVATVVALPEPQIQPKMGRFTKDGKRWVVADPTYLGADTGQIMPQYRDIAPGWLKDTES